MKTPQITWIDLENWPRKTHFQSFSTFSKCLIHTTIRLDVSRLYDFCKATGHRFFPTVIVLVAKAANQMPEFRMVLSPEGKPGIWNYVSPVYSIWHEDDKTFSSICTEWIEDGEGLYRSIVDDMARYAEHRGHIVSPILQNILPTSCEPDLDFESFHVQPCGDAVYTQSVAPLIIWGKMTKHDGRRTMPMTVSINHLAADGYHLSQFFKNLQELFDRDDPII